MSQTYTHPSEEVLERYALNRLPEEEVSFVEEHLLRCKSCQDRLQSADDFIRAFRVAAVRLPSTPQSWKARLKGSLVVPGLLRPIPAAGALAAVVAAVVMMVPRQSPPGHTEISLSVTRGDAMAGVSIVPSNHTLAVNLDLTGVANLPAYMVHLADSSGSLLWSGVLAPADGRLTVHLTRPLSRGQHWLRVQSPAPHARLLREFGLKVK